MKIFQKNLTFSALLLCLSFMSYQALSLQNSQADKIDQQTIVIYSEKFPPYNYMEKGQVTGINAEIIRRICLELNLHCEFIELPWKRAFRRTQLESNAGLISTARLLEREDMFTWLGPLVSGQNCIYKLANRQDIVVNNKEDLLKYMIGAAKDDSYIELLSNIGYVNNKNLVLAATKLAVLDPFISGRTDLLINSPTSLGKTLSRSQIGIQDLYPVYKLSQESVGQNYMALSLAFDNELLLKMKAKLEELRNRGELNSIRSSFVQAQNIAKPPQFDKLLWDTCILDK